ncbi:MAG: hypothetical protein ACRDP7_08375, partial [Trebonia sp.]
MRTRPLPRAPLAAATIALALAGCGSSSPRTAAVAGAGGVSARAADSAQRLGVPALATRNTTRINGADPIADAAGVARAVYPSAAPGTHPTAVTLAPTGDWQAALASSVLMAPPLRAPVLLSGPKALPAATRQALSALAPTGSGAAAGARLIRVGPVPAVGGPHAASISGAGPY